MQKLNSKMVSKRNFPQNGRPMQRGVRSSMVPYKKPFKAVGNNFNQSMFNASQIPDNPGYMDFNNPTPPVGIGNIINVTAAAGAVQQKKKNTKKLKNKQQQQQPPQQQQQVDQREQQHQHRNKQNVNGWDKSRNLQNSDNRRINSRFNGGGGGGMRFQRRLNNIQMDGYNRIHHHHHRNMMPPPIGPRVGPIPPPPSHAFQPPMIPPMGHGPMPTHGPQPPHFMRRNGRNIPMPHMPPMMPPPPRIPRGLPPIRYEDINKIKKSNKLIKKITKSKSTIKTLKNIENQYPMDKPWISIEIRTEHTKKLDIENRLVGNKDDVLFAQFKTQRDKFVAMYEKAREDYLKKEAAAVKAKDAKDNESKNGNGNEAISNAKA